MRLAKASLCSMAAYCLFVTVAARVDSWQVCVHLSTSVGLALPVSMAVPTSTWRTLARLALPEEVFEQVQAQGVQSGASEDGRGKGNWLSFESPRRLTHVFARRACMSLPSLLLWACLAVHDSMERSQGIPSFSPLLAAEALLPKDWRPSVWQTFRKSIFAAGAEPSTSTGHCGQYIVFWTGSITARHWLYKDLLRRSSPTELAVLACGPHAAPPAPSFPPHAVLTLGLMTLLRTGTLSALIGAAADALPEAWRTSSGDLPGSNATPADGPAPAYVKTI